MYNILCLIFDKCTRELEVGNLTFNFFNLFSIFHSFSVHSQNTFLQLIFVYEK